MDTFAALLGFGTPEIILLIGVIVVVALVVLVVKSFLKGFAGKKEQ